MTREIAEQKITNWLDKMKVFSSIRKKYQDNIDILIEGLSNGVLQYDDQENSITHELLFPFKERTMLKYKSHLNDRILSPYLKGVNLNDSEKVLQAIIGALTDTPRGVIAELNSMDKKISSSIAIFFF